MGKYFRTLFCSYAEVFFIPDAWPGAVILAITLLHPNMAVTGLIAVLAAYGFARLVGMEKQFLESGYYTYNPLLVGLSLGYLLNVAALTVFFVACAGVMTFLVTVFTANVFLTYLRMPILSLPFVIVSSIAYLASARYWNLVVQFHSDSGILIRDFGLPFWLGGFFKAFGAVLFTPSVVVGMALGAVVLRHSRILFLLALLGYYVGATIRTLMVASATLGYTDPNNFNFIFIAMAVGGVFLIPSLTSYLLAAIAVAVSTVFMDAITAFWCYYGIPAFTLPFNVVTLAMVYALRLVGNPMIPASMGRTPEETLENHLANRLRYRGQQRTLYLPFAGQWTVWQAWDGPWTHKGPWRYAYDFVIADDHGATHGGDGSRLEDYHAWNKPVLAPVRGRVAQIVDDFPDNPIGGADENNNWGNAVVIEDPRGFFVELSHFAAKSIRVNKGDMVERGTVLGLCGNSGYSTQPHIHVQAQATDVIGTTSLPFSFVSYADDGQFQSNHLPGEQHAVEGLYRDKRLDNITNFVLDDQLHYQVRRGGQEAGRLELTVKMALDGTFYFQSQRGQLYFGKHEGTFYFYRVSGTDPWLDRLFVALPRLPLAYRQKLAWHDYIPVGLVMSGLRGAAVGFLSSLYPRLATAKVSQTFADENRVESVIEAGFLRGGETAVVELDRSKGFASVTVGDIEFRQIHQNASTAA